MRALVVNNGSGEPSAVCDLLKGYDIDVRDREKLEEVDANAFDLTVLTGSSQDPIVYNKEKLADEHNLILNTQKPLIGICYGCELIAHAFGGKLVDRGDGSQKRDLVRIRVVSAHPIFDGRKEFEAYDSHRWSISEVPDSFSVLAESDHGPEIIKHDTLPVWGFQFHPEKCTDKSLGDEMMLRLIDTFNT